MRTFLCRLRAMLLGVRGLTMTKAANNWADYANGHNWAGSAEAHTWAVDMTCAHLLPRLNHQRTRVDACKTRGCHGQGGWLADDSGVCSPAAPA